MLLLQPEAKSSTGGAGPPEGREEGGAVDPGSARPKSPPPLSREEEVRHREGEGQEAEVPRPQGPEETALAPGTTPSLDDADLGGAVRPAHVEVGRAIVASSVAPEAPTAGGEGDA